MISLAIDYHFAKTSDPTNPSAKTISASVFHRTNLLLHLFNVLLVFGFIYLLAGKNTVSASVVAVLFAIHPMHVESVAWIAERKDVLYTFFFLAGLISYLKYLEKKKVVWFIATGFLYLMSLLSKPSAVVFPLVLIAIDYFRHRPFGLKMILEKGLFIGFAILFGLITVMIQSKDAIADFSTFTLLQRTLFFAYGSVMYLFKLLVPIDLSAFYPYPHLNDAGYLPVIFYLAPLIFLVLAGLIILSARRTRVVAFGMAFFFVTIILVLQFVSVGTALMADRYTYVPAIGLFFIIGHYFAKVVGSKDHKLSRFRIPVSLALAGYLTFLVVLCHAQVKIWRDSETLWSAVIEEYPFVETAYKNRGNYYAGLNMTDKALADNLVLVSLGSRDPAVYSNMGNVYGLKGDTEKALDAYSKSISFDSLNYETYLNRAVTYARARIFDRAMIDFDKALSLNPGAIEVFRNRSYALLEMGESEKAIADYNILIAEDPGNDANYLYRGLCRYRLSRMEEAISDFRKCADLNPRNANALFNIAVILNQQKDYRGALQFVEKARAAGYPVEPAFEAELRKRI
jgi:tetratricopeptide (TPR) repeat protein